MLNVKMTLLFDLQYHEFAVAKIVTTAAFAMWSTTNLPVNAYRDGLMRVALLHVSIHSVVILH
jgi:hypothetical protein